MVELLAGIFWTKSQSPRYSPGGGGGGGGAWLQMTSALENQKQEFYVLMAFILMV